MFSRTPGKARRRRSNNGAPSTARKEPPKYETPMDELMACLDRMEELIEKTRRDFYEKPAIEPSKPKGALYLFRSRSDRRNSKEEKPPAPPSADSSPSPSTVWRRKEKEAKFIPMEPQEEEEMIELLRRVAELVITGEKSAAAALSRNEKRSRRQTSGECTGGEDEKDVGIDSPEDIDSHIALFEQFFERNALERIVSLVTGAAFSTPPPSVDTEVFSESGEKEQQEGMDSAGNSDEKNVAQEGDASEDESPIEDQPDDELASSEKKASDDPDAAGKELPEVNSCTMLPSLAIATQALQSVSILIQNVSRATSLYFLLSNNLINDLIALPLELYSTAEKNRQAESSSPPSPGKRFTSAEVAELATHFVTFLKSLALRMNVETLQFFLSYPGERAGEGSEAASSAHFSEEEGAPPFIKVDDGSGIEQLDSSPVTVEAVQVEFPLYARALEFCSAHQDSFVRVTAMNICLNTLRLATVGDEMDGLGLATPDRAHGSSPDGVLHNAQPLPLRERLAIAQHVCSPARVEELVSPIFTKLAQLWGVLEEQFREAETDARRGSVTDLTSATDEGVKKNTKLQKAKEEAKKKKLGESFRTSVADLHDELLLLEDVFNVGLTSLNEQIIEMMLATFVYPLLLQPLLQYIQQFPSTQEGGAKRRLSNAFSGDITGDVSFQSGIFGQGGSISHESAPAKTAIFALASVFHIVTNRPLLRLLLTAFLHPLSPNTTSESMVRACPDVACAGRHGAVCVRIDSLIAGMAENEKLTYSFGKATGRTRSRSGSIGDSSHTSLSDARCVFVLSPALVEILEGDPGDVALMTRSRPNQYRQALIRFLVGGTGMEQIKSLSILLIDSLATKFDRNFLGDILFGSGMKRFGDEIPMDERSLDARNAHLSDDRGIGGGGFIDSRRSLTSTSSRIGTDYLTEAVTALCVGIVNTSPGQDGLWKLEYDEIAAHALLCAICSNDSALQSAAKLLNRRLRQTASFLAQMPARIDYASIATTETGHQSLSLEDEDSCFGATMDKLVQREVRGGKLSILEELLMSSDQLGENNEYSLSVALESSFQDLTERTCNLMSSAGSGVEDADVEDPLQIAASAMLGLFRLDAFSNFLKELAATGAGVLQKRRLSGFSFSSDGTIVDTSMFLEDSMHRKVIAPLSKDFISSVLDQDDDNGRDKGQPAAGSVVGLVGRTAFPCVCEVPVASASLFTDSTGINSEGVQWHSLYLVFLGRYMILAEPEKGGSGGDGRVVTSCKLAQVHVEKDAAPPAATGSSARRLMISHDGFGKKPPSLFLFDESPQEAKVGPFKQLRKTRSSLDVWFEDENASEQAFGVLETKIAKAKAKRGNRLRDKLAPEDRMRYDPS